MESITSSFSILGMHSVSGRSSTEAVERLTEHFFSVVHRVPCCTGFLSVVLPNLTVNFLKQEDALFDYKYLVLQRLLHSTLPSPYHARQNVPDS